MLILVKLIGIVIIGIGIILLLNPKAINQIIACCQKGKRLYIAGILRILIGVIFLLTASQCRLPGIVLVLGILILITGILIFILGLERVKSILNWWNKGMPLVIRLIGLVTLAIGALLIYSV